MNMADLSDNATIKVAAKVKGICEGTRSAGKLCTGCIMLEGQGCRIGNPYNWNLPEKIEIPKEAVE